jgi:hypothetical protein
MFGVLPEPAKRRWRALMKREPGTKLFYGQRKIQKLRPA